MLPATLQSSIAEYATAAESANTRRAYAADWRIFRDWCAHYGAEATPAAPLTVCAFLTDQAKANISAATISRRVAALAFVHRATGLDSPINDAVRRILRGIRRTVGTTPQAKAPLTADLVKRVVDAMPAEAIRDRAIVLFGFASAMRRSELAALARGDFTPTPDGFIVRIARSKTDQEAAGTSIAVARGDDPAYCPVRAVELLLASHTADAVFGMTGHAIGCLVKRWARRAGLDEAMFGAHSLRSGFITSAALNGAPVFRILEHSRHKSMDSAKRYFHGEKFKQHPGRGLL